MKHTLIKRMKISQTGFLDYKETKLENNNRKIAERFPKYMWRLNSTLLNNTLTNANISREILKVF